MARKSEHSKKSGLGKEIRRRQHDAQRRVDREREAEAARAAAHEAHLEQIRRTLREAAAVIAAERRLAEALAPSSFGWGPWGYLLPEPAARPAEPVRPASWVDTPDGLRLRVAITLPPAPRRPRVGARSRFLALAGAAA